MSLSSVRSETALRSRLFSSSRSFRRFTCSVFSPPNSWRHRYYVTSLTPIWRIASTMFWPCETRTSSCRSFATISSGLYRFLAIAVLLDVKDIPQLGPLQWGWITVSLAVEASPSCAGRSRPHRRAPRNRILRHAVTGRRELDRASGDGVPSNQPFRSVSERAGSIWNETLQCRLGLLFVVGFGRRPLWLFRWGGIDLRPRTRTGGLGA